MKCDIVIPYHVTMAYVLLAEVGYSQYLQQLMSPRIHLLPSQTHPSAVALLLCVVIIIIVVVVVVVAVLIIDYY